MNQPRVINHWSEVIKFVSEGPDRTEILQGDGIVSVMVGLRAGQAIPPHPSDAATYHFMDGSGTMTVGEEQIDVQAGVTICVPAGTPRGVSATSQMTFLASRAAPTGPSETSATSASKKRRMTGAALAGMVITMGAMVGLMAMPILMSPGGGGRERLLYLPIVGMLIMAGTAVFLFLRMRKKDRMGGHRH